MLLFIAAAAMAQTAPRPPRSVTLINPSGDDGTTMQMTWIRSLDEVPSGIVKQYWLYLWDAGTTTVVAKITATKAWTYSYTYTGLTPGKKYYFKIRAYDGASFSSFASFQADSLPPGPPQNVKVEDVPGDNGTALKISFDRSADDGIGSNDVTEYRIYKLVSSGYILMNTVAATDSASYSITKTVTAGSRLSIKVAAFDGYQESSSVWATGATVDNVAPRPARYLKLVNPTTDSGGTMELQWTRSLDDVSTGDVKEYWLYLWYGGTTTLAARVTATKAWTYSYTYTGLVPGRKYYFKIRAWDGTNFSTWGSVAGDSMPPGAPQNVKVTDVPNDNGTALTISFDRSSDDGIGSNDVTEYRIYKLGSSAYLLMQTVPATDAASYSITKTVSRSSRMSIKVAAFDGYQESAAIWASGAAVNNLPPGPPQNVRLVNPTTDAGDTMQMRWAPSVDDKVGGDVAEYWLYLWYGGTTTLVTKVTAKQATSYSYTYKNLVPGRRYYFQIRAWDGTNLSTIVSIVADSLPPGPPQNVQVVDVPNDDGGVLQVKFGRSADDGIGFDDVKEYRIYQQSSTGTYSLLATVTATNASSYTYTVSGLATTATLNVKVTAFDGYQESTGVTASGTSADNTAPRPARNLTVEDYPGDDGTSLVIKFDASLDDTTADREVTRYDIYRAGSATGTGAVVKAITATRVSRYEWRNTGLTAGTNYWYWVVAVAGTGETATAKVVAKPLDQRSVSPPTGLTAADRPYDNGGVIDLQWSRSADDGAGYNHVIKYNIYRRMANVVTPPDLIATVTATGAATYTWADTAVPMELILYDYTVTAASGSVESSAAGPARAASENNNVVVFNPPTNLTAVDRPGDSGGCITLTWTRSTSEDEIGPPPPPPSIFSTGVNTQGTYGGQYEFYRRTASGSYSTQPTFVVDESVSGNPMTYANTGLTNGVRYYYKVRYRRYSQISEFTAEASAIPAVGGTSTASAGATDSTSEVAPAQDDNSSASAPAADGAQGAISVSLSGAGTQCVAGQNLAVKAQVNWKGSATTYLEYTINGGTIMRTAATSGTNAFSAGFTLPTETLTAGTVVQVRAVATGGGLTAWSGTSTVTIAAK
ncbi:MAG: fibronectin type III domain-containing protein [Armatimonadia bacterium]